MSGVVDRLRAAYRRTGADLPGGDPRPSHGAEMEGYFWRFTDPAERRVVLALCGVNRHPDGDWATVAVAAHPGRVVRSAAVDGAVADTGSFRVVAGDVFEADEHRLRVDLDGLRLEARVERAVGWPLRLGGGGVFSALPWLGQYWHPHVLGGDATVDLTVDGTPAQLVGADVYAEKNWGAGFPERWWWGQAQGFERRDVCVAFGGGRLAVGPLTVDVGGVAVRLGDDVLRVTPPTGLVRPTIGDGRWVVDARRVDGWHVRVEGHGLDEPPHVLPVPIPAERRNVDHDLEHLAGFLRLEVSRRGRAVFEGTSRLAALEVGAVDARAAANLRREFAPALP